MAGCRTAERLIVALDVPTRAAAEALAERIGDAAGVLKIGHELIFGGDGMALARELAAGGQRIFLDAKLLDIANTVEKATANIAATGAHMLTVHGHDGKTLDAAVRGRGASGMKLLAVTVLTNLTDADLTQQGQRMDARELVLHRARLAREAGFDGVIASGEEAADVRAATGADFLIVTPGIRPAGAAAGDQARVMTPARAIAAGATHLVVGRPITEAADPAAAARAIVAEIAASAR
ncbi:MAG: orotidine-5'-phosphate decarboxylase [Rhizobiales bacterium]|nr:orotidine-5'-phosphate decarboxylase [Hyphomicrobiales bacterium]